MPRLQHFLSFQRVEKPPGVIALPKPVTRLSRRETSYVLKLRSQGWSYDRIAKRVGISATKARETVLIDQVMRSNLMSYQLWIELLANQIRCYQKEKKAIEYDKFLDQD